MLASSITKVLASVVAHTVSGNLRLAGGSPAAAELALRAQTVLADFP